MLLEIITGLGRALPQSFRSGVSKLPRGSWVKFGPAPVLVNKVYWNSAIHIYLFTVCGCFWVSLVAQVVKNPPANAGDVGLILGLVRSPG